VADAPIPPAAPTRQDTELDPREEDATPVRPSNTRLKTVRRENAPPIGPPSGSMLWLGAIAALGLGIAAIYVFLHGRSAVMAPDAAPHAVVVDAAVTAPVGIDAATAPAFDAAALIDEPRDATVRATVDAAVAHPAIIDGAVHVAAIDAVVAVDARPGGTATLVVGADPWGEIVVDGEPRGNTPGTLVVTAGHHVVQVIYRGVDPPKTRSYTVDLLPGETNHLPISSFVEH
jgi:hypothetical protein